MNDEKCLLVCRFFIDISILYKITLYLNYLYLNLYKSYLFAYFCFEIVIDDPVAALAIVLTLIGVPDRILVFQAARVIFLGGDGRLP